MKLLDANKDKVVIEFTKEEFLALSAISYSVREEYDTLDQGILNLEEDEVIAFSKDVGAILNDYGSQGKHLKD